MKYIRIDALREKLEALFPLGMGARVKVFRDLSDWLDANAVEGEFEPTPVKEPEKVKAEGGIDG